MCNWFKASAPGSFFWMGEHSVLRGGRAILSAVDLLVRGTLTPNHSSLLCIDSSLGKEEIELFSLSSESSSRFPLIVDVFQRWKERLPSGCTLKIEADFSDQVGLGSSAAVTVVTWALLYLWMGEKISPEQLFFSSLKTIRAVQGQASGADLAASIFGGLLHYTAPRELTPPLFEKLPMQSIPSFFLLYSGEKMKTAEVITRVEEREKLLPDLFCSLFGLMEDCTSRAVKAIRRNHWEQLGALLNFYQGLLDSLGVNNHALSSLIYHARSLPTVWGSKISGAGLGDCVLVLERDKSDFFVKREGYISLSFYTKGLQYETG